jgi:multidrug resistance efflux pump
LNLKDSIRGIVSQLPPGLLVFAAAAGFWVLSHGMTSGPTSITGYAEEHVHHVGPLQGGRLKSVAVTLGQAVRAGDMLASFDGQALELERARLQATLARAKAQLVAEQDLQSAALSRGQLQAVRTHASEERARAELRELDLQVKRMEELSAQKLIRADQLEEARRKQRAVAADLLARPKGSEQELERMGLRPRPQSEQSERLEERLAPFRAAVQIEEAALRKLEHAITELVLRAPVDGVVGAVLQQPGDVLGTGAPVVTIITMRPGRIVAFIPERQVRSLGMGDAVWLYRVGSFRGALRAHVAELAPGIEQAPPRTWASQSTPLWARRVVLALDEPAVLLPGEMFRVGTR